MTIPEARKAELAAKLRSGDKSVIGELIAGHLGLAINIARRYGSDDLVSESMLAMVAACNNCQLKDDNITRYLASKIHTACIDYLRNDHILRVPHSTLHAREKAGKTTIVFKRQSMKTKIKDGGYAIIDLRELLSRCTYNDLERKILQLRSEGYNDREISNQLNLTPARIGQIRAIIEERFNTLTAKFG